MPWLGFEPDAPPAVRTRVTLVLVAAVFGISTSAILVRGMEADPLAITAWRTLGAAIVLAPAVWWGRGTLGGGDGWRLAAAGVAIALHFWAWFAALAETTVLRATVLVCSVPIWTALAEWAWFGVRPRRGHWVGLAVALPGLGLLVGSGGRSTWAGDVLAVGAAVAWALYFLLGRDVRRRVDAVTTLGLVCAVSAAVTFPIAAVAGTSLVGFDAGTWGRLALAVLGPQLVGHLGFVYAVRWLPAATVSTVALLEPVGATLLAALFLAEIPEPSAIVGGLLVLVGVGIASR